MIHCVHLNLLILKEIWTFLLEIPGALSAWDGLEEKRQGIPSQDFCCGVCAPLRPVQLFYLLPTHRKLGNAIALVSSPRKLRLSKEHGHARVHASDTHLDTCLTYRADS